MNFGIIMRWLSVGLRIGAILDVLKGVDARAAGTTSQSYVEAVPVALASTSTDFLARLTPDEQANLESTMRVALFWLDWKTQ